MDPTKLFRNRQSTNATLALPSPDVLLDEQVDMYKNYVDGSAKLIDTLNLYQTKPLNIVRDKQSSLSIVSTDAATLAPRLAPIKLASESLQTTANVHREWTASELGHYSKSKPIIANYSNWMRDQAAPAMQEIRTMQMARNQYDAAVTAHARKQVPDKKKKVDQTKERYESIRDSLVTTKFNTMEKTYDDHRAVCVELFKEMKSFHLGMVTSSEAPFTALLAKLDDAAKKNAGSSPSADVIDDHNNHHNNKNNHHNNNTTTTTTNNNNNKTPPPPVKKLAEPSKDDGQYECLDNITPK